MHLQAMAVGMEQARVFEPGAGRATVASAAALEARLRELAPLVLRTCRGVLGADDAEDAAQESLIELLKALPSLRAPGAARSFAARIAVRTALRRRRRRRLPVEPMAAVAEPAAQEESAEPDRQLWLARRRDAVRALLDRLPEAQAEAIALRYMLGWSLPEIAAVSDVPVNTVRSRIRLARAAALRLAQDDPMLSELRAMYGGSGGDDA